MKAIALAGHRGFIGSHLYDRLRKMGHDVDTLGGRIADEFHAHTLVEGCDTLFICAGVTGGAGLLARDPRALVWPNVKLHHLLFEACSDVGCRKIVCMGSTTGYPERDRKLLESDYFAEDPPACYFNPGHARRFIERMAGMYPELAVSFLRTTNVYGPGDNYEPETSHVIGATIRKVAERHDPITVWGDGADVRDAIYIDDMVDALLAAAEGPPGSYNIGLGHGAKVTEILGLLCLAAKHEATVSFDSSKPSLLRSRLVSIEKARQVLKWTPKVSLDDGLERTLADYINNG